MENIKMLTQLGLLVVYVVLTVSPMFAQRSTHIDMPTAVVESPGKSAGKANPGIGGRDGSSGNQGAGGGAAAPSQPRDPYPALTAANNAYEHAVTEYQSAYQNYQNALARQAALKAKYLDNNGSVRSGWDYYAAVAVLRKADDDAMAAYYDLSNAEKAKNSAHSRAAKEFKNAVEQFERARAAEKAAAEESQKRQQQESQREHACARC